MTSGAEAKSTYTSPYLPAVGPWVTLFLCWVLDTGFAVLSGFFSVQEEIVLYKELKVARECMMILD